MARILAIVDITLSAIDLLTLTPAIKKLLSQSEAGKWFLSHWHMISFCVNLGTISYYLAKGIMKYGPQVRKYFKGNKQMAENFDELIEESRRVADNIEGFGKYGGKVLTEADLEDWASFLKKEYGTKLEKVDKFDDADVLAQFNPNTNTIHYREDATEYFIAHESFHAHEMNKLDFKNMSKMHPWRELN